MPAWFSKYTFVVALASVVFLSSACQGKSEASADSAQRSEETAEKQVDSSAGVSADTSSVPKGLVDTITKKFSEARKDLKVIDVVPTDAKGVYQVMFDGKGSVYAVGSGDFFFVGDLYEIQGQRIVNVTEQASNGPRAELIASINQDDMIVFSPEGEVKASVVVFTDVDCGYCRKLHQEVPKMNELGIEIKYLAYPRAGVGSNSYNKIASAWCAEDRLEAMNQLKAGKNIPTNVCDGNPVAQQFNLGIQAGLSGTPAIVLETGELIPGYMPAERLAQTLGI